MSKTLSEALADFEEDTVMEMVENRLDTGEDPMNLVRELQQGMGLVGERFSSGNYFLSELIMSADVFNRAMQLVEPRMKGSTRNTLGKIVLGTPKGDIHEIGKNIFCTVARGAGFEVHDLGVDVPVDRFLKAIDEIQPDILGFSSLITTAFQPMKQVVDALIKKGQRDRIKIIVGGGVTTETVKRHLGADAQTTEAMEGLNLCKKMLGI